MHHQSKFLSSWGHIFLSIALHAAFVFAMFFHAQKVDKKPEPIVELEYIESPQPVRKKIVRVRPQQIVEQENRVNDKVDKKTNLLSAFNQQTQKETQAKARGKFKNVTKAAGHKEVHKDITSDFALPKGEAGAGEGKSATSDYLEDIETGMKTVLNTREFTYYTYYNKIRAALEKHWEPKVRHKVTIIHKKNNRELASLPAGGQVTQILVTLDRHGGLLKVDILRESGVEAFDAAAKEAFREAAPFPDPPPGIVEVNGTIRIRWDFVLSI